MKFGDKLVELRKKNGYSQEELAEKLGVSRQSVSKWESNNTYPETDKIIQIANIFDCSMDDLINDKITDVETTLRKNKNNIYNMWDSLLEFITKTINMFSKMKFIDGFKCIIEMIIVAFILSLLGKIICGAASSTISNIFAFLSHEHVLMIRSVLNSIFKLIWLIIAVITLIHTFKIRYLNYYDKNLNDNSSNDDKNIVNDDSNPANSKDNEKIIIRDEKDKPFAFLGGLSKVVIVFIKFIAFWILLGNIFAAIGLIFAGVITIAHIPVHIIFLWISLMLIAASIVSIQIINILISFIFNKKINIVTNLIIFISCIVLAGLSIGMTALTAKNIEYISDSSIYNPKTEIIELNYKDNLVIASHFGINNLYEYVIDNSIENNKIIASREVDTKYYKLDSYETEMDKMPVIKVFQKDNADFKVFYNLFIKNLKKNKIYTFEDYGEDPLIIKGNEETINKLIENQKKLWLVEEERKDNQINIITHDEKVYFPRDLEGEYNAIDDTIKYNNEGYSCKKEIEKTEYGEKFVYTCDYQENE